MDVTLLFLSHIVFIVGWCDVKENLRTDYSIDQKSYNTSFWWNVSYLLAWQGVLHWWVKLSCALVRYSRPVEGYSGTLHKCGSWEMYSFTRGTVRRKMLTDKTWAIAQSKVSVTCFVCYTYVIFKNNYYSYIKLKKACLGVFQRGIFYDPLSCACVCIVIFIGTYIGCCKNSSYPDHPDWNGDSRNQSFNCSWVTVVLDHRAPNAGGLRHQMDGGWDIQAHTHAQMCTRF